MVVFNFLVFLSLILFIPLNAVEKLVIIGKGPAGCSAAIFAGQGQLSPLVIEGQECDGQLVHVSRIENYPGFPETVSGEDLVEKMRVQAEQAGARFKDNHVIKVNCAVRPFEITLDNGEIVSTSSMIIATGTLPRWLNVPHEDALRGKGISTSALCDGKLFVDQSVVVAGGGDAALEQAILLTAFARQVTIIHRSKQWNASQYLIERIHSHPKIQVLLNTQIQAILGEEEEWVKGVVFQNNDTKKQDILLCDGVFVAIGRIPNTHLFKDQLDMDDQGFILTQPGTSMTSVEGIFAAGDITPGTTRKVVTAVASGCIAATEAMRFLNN